MDIESIVIGTTRVGGPSVDPERWMPQQPTSSPISAVRHRFGAIGKTGSIALVEQLWKTLKNRSNLRTSKPLLLQDLEQRLYLGLLLYAFFQPHQGLAGATPAEFFFGCPPAQLAAVPPPRAGPREGSNHSPFEIAFLDLEHELPFSIRKAT